MRHAIRNRSVASVAVLGTLLAMSGCSTVDDQGPAFSTAAEPAPSCCTTIDRYPGWLVRLAELGAPVTIPIIASIQLRKGFIDHHTDAQAHIADGLRPLDIISAIAGARGSLVPGLFDHNALYLGDAEDMRALGLWDDPLIVSWRDRLTEGPMLIEAHRSGVRIQRLDQVIDVDHVAIVRPSALSRSARRDAVRRALALVGTPFDFRFDNGSGNALFCTELVLHVLPGLRVPVRRAYGRDTIVPDELTRAGLVPGSGLSLALYLKADRDNWRIADADTLVADLEDEWRRYGGMGGNRMTDQAIEADCLR